MEKMIMFYEEKLEKWGIYLISAPLILMTGDRGAQRPRPQALHALSLLPGGRRELSGHFRLPGVAIVPWRGACQRLPADRPVLLSGAVCAGRLRQFSGAMTFGFLAFGAWKEAFRAVGIWRCASGCIVFPVALQADLCPGMTMLAIQLVVNVVKFIHRAMGHSDYAKIKAEAPEKILMQV